MTGTAEERFWAKVNKTETCWLWTGSVNEKGYGQFWPTNKRAIRAHRYSWIIHYGVIPKIHKDHSNGTCVLHMCDTPACVRPDHLFLGSNQENMNDKVSKGRQSHIRLPGEAHPNCQITEQIVKKIREIGQTRNRPTHMEIAKLFGISRQHVGDIINYKRWRDL